MNDLTPDQERRKHRIELAIKVAAVLALGFFVGPVILITIKGLIGLLVACAIALAAINFTPWFATMIANWRLKALKYEASKNPIETLENQYQERQTALVNFRQYILSSHAELQNFYGELEGFKQRYPEKSAKFDEQYANMKALLAARAAKYKEAQKQLVEFGDLIEQKRSEWKLAQAAAQMNKAAGVGEDFISKLMADTALDSVQTSLNLAFSELQVSLLDEKSPTDKALPRGTPPLAVADKSGPPTLDLEFEPLPERKTAR